MAKVVREKHVMVDASKCSIVEACDELKWLSRYIEYFTIEKVCALLSRIDYLVRNQEICLSDIAHIVSLAKLKKAVLTDGVWGIIKGNLQKFSIYVDNVDLLTNVHHYSYGDKETQIGYLAQEHIMQILIHDMRIGTLHKLIEEIED